MTSLSSGKKVCASLTNDMITHRMIPTGVCVVHERQDRTDCEQIVNIDFMLKLNNIMLKLNALKKKKKKRQK